MSGHFILVKQIYRWTVLAEAKCVFVPSRYLPVAASYRSRVNFLDGSIVRGWVTLPNHRRNGVLAR